MTAEEQTTIQLRIFALTLAKINGRHKEQRLAERNLDVGMLQFGIMRVLCFGPHTLSEMSRHMALDPSTLVPAVDKLEQKGHLRRERDPRDRRRVPLALTDAGRAIIDSMPNIEDDDPILLAIRVMGLERADQLALLMRELLEQMPEGREMLAEFEHRLRMYGTQPFGG
jgi:DNA-binding MarR family transcriptional regulator